MKDAITCSPIMPMAQAPDAAPFLSINVQWMWQTAQATTHPRPKLQRSHLQWSSQDREYVVCMFHKFSRNEQSGGWLITVDFPCNLTSPMIYHLQ